MYEWNFIVKVLKNSPHILQRVLSKALNGLTGNGVEVYMDDIVIHSRRVTDHDILVKKVLDRLNKNNLILNKKKIQYRKEQVDVLGVRIDGTYQYPLEDKRDKLINAKIPKNISEMRSFLGLLGWFREYIEKYSDKTHELTNSLRTKDSKMCKWTDNMNKEFENLKKEIEKLKKLRILD